jgi:hypothetical protein
VELGVLDVLPPNRTILDFGVGEEWATNRLEGEELALFDHELLGREIDIRGFAGCGRIPANTQTIEREPAASFKPPADHYQN